MSKFFFPKLAGQNIKKNAKFYLPYLLTGIATVMMYFIIASLAKNQSLQQLTGGGILSLMLNLGSFIVALFSATFLLYTNSFLMKRRKKEFGLYSILGMEKNHIATVIFFETLFVAVISMVAGISLGLLCSKLVFLALLKLLHFPVQLGFAFSLQAMKNTLGLFTVVFLFTLLNNLVQVYAAQPIELLKGSSIGEKEPKIKWLLTLLGILSLGGGYYIAITVEDPLTAIILFFIAVILVIIGTYCLFISGSIALLKLLRQNKKFYYQARHFVSISGMLYRMKQNATGLANICILSTMVLVMLSTTVCLYVGMEDIMEKRYPKEMMFELSDYSDQTAATVISEIEEILQAHQLPASQLTTYRCLSFASLKQGTMMSAETSNLSDMGNMRELYFIPLQDYNRIYATSFSLAADEIMLYSNRSTYTEATLSVFDSQYKVKNQLKNWQDNGFDAAQMVSSHYVIVSDFSVLQDIEQKQMAVYGENRANLYRYIGVDIDAEDAVCIDLYHDIQDIMRTSALYSESRAEARSEFYSLYGSLFFLGIFLGALFLMATVLIIYYKQISEGYDDNERFQIMQKVGMSKEEVGKTIKSQVLAVFLLPLVVACLHLAFAFKFITKLLSLFAMTDRALFAICLMATIAVFAVFYAFVYLVTSRTYYRIVSN